MTVRLRWENCCESEDCTKPAHIGSLCAPCYMAASPARRAVELLEQSLLAPSVDHPEERRAA